MLWQAIASARDFGRLYDIASVLARYGFGDMVRRVGLAGVLERAGKALKWPDAHDYAHLSPPARVRCALEELGPCFVKLGQVLATRVDLLEPEWIAELGKLHDRAQPVPYDAIRAQLIEDLGGPPEELFAWFDPEPMAAGSLAQVHCARLHGGGEVILKIRRPDIRPVIEADLRLLARLAQLAEAESPSWRALRPQQVVREFAQSLRRELDFSTEARNARTMADNFRGYSDGDSPAEPDMLQEPTPPILIPQVYWDCERVCVQERVIGIAGSRLDDVDAAGLDRQVLARRGARAVLKMILADGLFHADPHPGNVFYLPDNRIAFIDFGMVGRLTQERREQLLRLLLGLVQHRPAEAAEVLMDWTGSSTAAEEGLLTDLESFVDEYRGVPLRELRLGAMLEEVVGMLRRYRLVLPADLSMLVKAFISLEGMGRALDPEFDMASQALPVLKQAMRDHYSPQRVLQRGWGSVRELLAMLASAPRDLSRLLRTLRRGRLDIHIEVAHLLRVGHQLDRAASRLAVGLVVAALIIGSSIVMTVPGGPSLLGLPVFGLFGFLGALAGGAWLLLSVWRSGRGGGAE